MKRYLPPIGLIAVIIGMIYLEAPYSLINKNHVQVTSIPNEVILANVEAVESEAETVTSDSEMTDERSTEETNSEEEVSADYTLELILEGKSIDNDYVIEEFREYEVYRDEEGKVIKSVPTSNFDYLRYYQEQ